MNKKVITKVLALLIALPLMTQAAFAAGFSGKVGSKYTVTDGGQIVYGSGSGGYSNSRKCDLGDDLGSRYSYCVQPAKSSPATGSVTVDKVLTDEDDKGKWNALRNIVYYSPSYPGYDQNVKNIRGTYYTGNFSKDWGIAHMALSYVYAGRPSDMATWGGTSASDLGEVWTKAKKLGDALWSPDSAKDDAVPDSFKVFIAYMSGVQDMIVGYLESPGYLEMTKSSNLPDVSDGNACYTLEGAEYTVYDSSDKAVGKLITKADGKSNVLELPEGKYTVKETKAPKGYALDKQVVNVKVSAEDTTTFSAKDTPIMNIVNLLLTKKPSGYPHNHGEGDAGLSGAVYRFNYYDGHYNSASAAEGSGKPTAQWFFTTDAKGEIAGANPVPASGYTSSALYKDAAGKVAFPLGTYVIQEVSAPTGYLLNNEKIVVQITEDGTDVDHVKTYNEKASHSDTVIHGGVKLAKIDHDRKTAVPQGDATLEGAEFTIYNKSKETVMVGGKEIAKDAAALVIKTNKNGVAASGAKDLPYGTYLVKETKAPTGYHLNETWSKTFSIRADGEVKDLTETPAEEIVQKGGVKLLKIDHELKRAYAQGDATLAGAEFTIYNQSAQSVFVGGKEYAKGAAVMTIKTDANGAASTANNVLPFGTYSVKEAKAPVGYLLNSSYNKTFEIREANKIVDISDSAAEDQVYRGGVKIAKIDNDLDEAYAQGDATLSGAEFTIYNKSAHNVFVDGKEQKKEAAVLVIKTNEQGIATTSADALPYGTYLIKETKPSNGYLLNTEWNKTFQIRENGVIIDLTEEKVREAVERGGVQIVKRDKEIAKSEALGGATLEGIVFTIKNASAHDVVVRADIGNTEDKVDWKKLESKKELFDNETIKRVKPGEDVGKIVTHWNEAKKAYTAETLADDLPYGTYTIRESKTNDTYQRTDKTEHKFEVRKDGTLYAYDSEGMADILTFDDYVYRSDMQGTKIGDGDSKRFTFVPFKITSVSNGETHVVVADKNGFFSTKDRRTKDGLDEDEDADNARKLNPMDNLLEAKEIKNADLEKRYTEILMGVWFGTGEFGTKAEMNPDFGALPYDSYVIEELPCETNEGYTLQKFFFTVDEKSQNGFVDLETITDDIPEIGTTASVNGKSEDVAPAKEITLTDVIEYSGLKKLTKYVAKGKLMDKATGEVLKDAAGKEITAEREFTTVLSKGKVKVEFKFDASNLYGKETVVFEKLYDTEGHVIAVHEDINDEGQTVTWKKPSIGTTLADGEGNKTVVASDKTTLVDTISYEGLDTTQWYVFEGTLMVKETGDPLVENGTPVTVISEPFMPKEVTGTTQVTFVIDTTNLIGKELVAYETAYKLQGYKEGDKPDEAKKIKIAEHKDLEDEGQTVKITEPVKPEEPKKPETPRDTPETGDNNMLKFFVVLMAIAAFGITAFAGREAQRKIRQRREDREIFKS